jgi:hypothetical protein
MQIRNRGLIFKLLCRAILGIMVTSALEIMTLRNLHKSFTSPGCDFVPPNQIVIVSLNGFRMRVPTHYNTQTVPQIHKTLVFLDSWYHILDRGTPLL